MLFIGKKRFCWTTGKISCELCYFYGDILGPKTFSQVIFVCNLTLLLVHCSEQVYYILNCKHFHI